MPDDERSLWDRAKDALGMGDRQDRDHDHEHGEPGEAWHADDSPGVEGATQGSASSGAAGGLGATGAMGGAGAAGPVGVTPDPSRDVTAPASGDQIRTEYEMGHEFDPEHEKVAESGVRAEQAGEAEVDTWRRTEDDEEDDAAG